MQELTHYINGAHVKGTSGRFADVYNPATGEVQAKVPLANSAQSSIRPWPTPPPPSPLGPPSTPSAAPGF